MQHQSCMQTFVLEVAEQHVKNTRTYLSLQYEKNVNFSINFFTFHHLGGLPRPPFYATEHSTDTVATKY